MTPFAETLILRAVGDNVWEGEADPDYAHSGGRFGGWTASIVLRAVMLEPGERGEPLSATMMFLSMLGDGRIEIRTRLLREGARLEFWQAELWQGDRLCVHAQFTFGVRRKTLSFVEAQMPEARPPEDPSLVIGGAPAPFGRLLPSRWVTPPPMSSEDDDRGVSLFWTRHVHDLALDHTMLALLADYGPPRLFLKRPVMSSTVSMNIYFHATASEIERVGSDYVLSEITSRRCEGGYFDHQAILWSRDGALLAASEQVGVFRD